MYEAAVSFRTREPTKLKLFASPRAATSQRLPACAAPRLHRAPRAGGAACPWAGVLSRTLYLGKSKDADAATRSLHLQPTHGVYLSICQYETHLVRHSSSSDDVTASLKYDSLLQVPSPTPFFL